MHQVFGRSNKRALVVIGTLCFAQQSLHSKSEGKKSGGNPLDCHVPVCTEKMDMFRKATKGLKTTPTVDKSSNADNVIVKPTGLPPAYAGCPLDRSEVGNSSWDLLHTMAANYPDHPTEEQQRRMREFFEALALFYPCIHCAGDFQTSIKNSPPR